LAQVAQTGSYALYLVSHILLAQARMRLLFFHTLFLVYGSNAETPLVATCRGPQLLQVKQQTSSVQRSFDQEALVQPNGSNTSNISRIVNRTSSKTPAASTSTSTTQPLPAAEVIPILPASPPVPAVVVEPWQSSPVWAPAPPMVPVMPGQVIPLAPVAGQVAGPPVVVPVAPCDGSAPGNTYNNVTVNIAGDVYVNGKGSGEDAAAPVSIPSPAPAPPPPPPATAPPAPAKPHKKKGKPTKRVNTTAAAAPAAATVSTTTKAAPVPSFVSKLFKPGKLGIMADWTVEPVVVDGVEEGSQAEEQAVEKGWTIYSISGIPYNETVLDAAIAGNATYNMTFQTNPDAAPPPAANMH